MIRSPDHKDHCFTKPTFGPAIFVKLPHGLAENRIGNLALLASPANGKQGPTQRFSQSRRHLERKLSITLIPKPLNPKPLNP